MTFSFSLTPNHCHCLLIIVYDFLISNDWLTHFHWFVLIFTDSLSFHCPRLLLIYNGISLYWLLISENSSRWWSFAFTIASLQVVCYLSFSPRFFILATQSILMVVFLSTFFPLLRDSDRSSVCHPSFLHSSPLMIDIYR